MSKDRIEKVLAVLKAADQPLGPSEIGRRIGEPWCFCGRWGMSAPITPLLRKIPGVVRTDRGHYSLPREIGSDATVYVVSAMKEQP